MTEGPQGAPIEVWVAFHVFVFVMLALDLGVFHREAHAVSMREALCFSLVWVLLALVFGAVVWWWHGAEAGQQWLLGYVIEKSLSVDNLFVFVMIFTYFGVPPAYQHRVLFWGIIGALVLRGLFIFAGVALIRRFHWMLYVFGAFLVYTGIKMMLSDDEAVEPEQNPLVRLYRRWFRSTGEFHGQKMFVRESGHLVATPLFVCLLVVESSDVIFALDSLPAIFGVTEDAFIIYTSNVFAILGLRSLYFLLAGMLDRFHYLKPAICLVLVLVGAKMLAAEVYKVSSGASLLVVLTILASGVVASLLLPPPPSEEAED